MTKERQKELLDFIPLIILIISAGILIWTVASLGTHFLWKQIAGLIILPINIGLFFWKHKLGVIALGMTILLGLIGLISYSFHVSISTIGVGPEGSRIPLFYGQPIFLLWLVIYFLICNKHFFQINTKKYWMDLFRRSSDQST